MLPIAMHLLQKDGQFLNGHDLFLKRVGAAYHAFIDETEKGCRWGLVGGWRRQGGPGSSEWVRRAGGERLVERRGPQTCTACCS